MSKKIKQAPSDPTFPPVSSFNKKILPIKRKFITFRSDYDYGCDYEGQILAILLENPKWYHLSLKLGHIGEYKEFPSLRRAKSLRLRSLHLSSAVLDSQFCGDNLNRYYGELDPFTRAGHTLKKLSLSVAYDLEAPENIENPKTDVFFRLKKFVKKQKHLDEFGIYMGQCGTSKWMSDLLVYMEKRVKTLTIENLAVDGIFKRYEFPKLETLRFEYHLIHGADDSYDFSLLKKALPGIFALPKLKSLVFSQFHRYDFESYFAEDRDLDLDCVVLPSEFWEVFRAELDKHQEKPLKILYHKGEDSKVEEKLENFKRIFSKLPPDQTFEYDVAWIHNPSDEEDEDEEEEEEEGEEEEEAEEIEEKEEDKSEENEDLDVEEEAGKEEETEEQEGDVGKEDDLDVNENENEEADIEEEGEEDDEEEEEKKGVRYLFYLDKVETISGSVANE